jgi:hypothetical protein
MIGMENVRFDDDRIDDVFAACISLIDGVRQHRNVHDRSAHRKEANDSLPDDQAADNAMSDDPPPDHEATDDGFPDDDVTVHCWANYRPPHHSRPDGVIMSNDKHGLSTPAEVEALADALSACADNLHTRLKNEAAAIGALPDDSAMRASRKATADRLLDAEQQLRQRANSLYTDATAAIVVGLCQPQQRIAALTRDAAEHIRKIALLSDVTGLVGGLLALAGGVASGQPAVALTALETIRTQLKAVKPSLPPKPA